eukprot:2573009-Karenia_brevis.AAC.1
MEAEAALAKKAFEKAKVEEARSPETGGQHKPRTALALDVSEVQALQGLNTEFLSKLSPNDLLAAC